MGKSASYFVPKPMLMTIGRDQNTHAHLAARSQSGAMRHLNHSNRFQAGRTSLLQPAPEARRDRLALCWVLLVVWLRLRVWLMDSRTSRRRSMLRTLGLKLLSEVDRRLLKSDLAAGRGAVSSCSIIGICGVD